MNAPHPPALDFFVFNGGQTHGCLSKIYCTLAYWFFSYFIYGRDAFLPGGPALQLRFYLLLMNNIGMQEDGLNLLRLANGSRACKKSQSAAAGDRPAAVVLAQETPN